MKAFAVLMTIFTLVGFSATQASAAQLERDQTVIIRYNKETRQAERLVVNRQLKNEADAQAAIKEGVAQGKFQKIPGQKVVRNELDAEHGTSSWFAWGGGWGWGWGAGWAAPTLWVGTVSWAPFYSCGWGASSFWLYGGCGWGRGWC